MNSFDINTTGFFFTLGKFAGHVTRGGRATDGFPLPGARIDSTSLALPAAIRKVRCRPGPSAGGRASIRSSLCGHESAAQRLRRAGVDRNDRRISARSVSNCGTMVGKQEVKSPISDADVARAGSASRELVFRQREFPNPRATSSKDGVAESRGDD